MLETAVAEPAGPPTLEEIDRLCLSGSRPLTQKVLDRARVEGRP